MNLCDTFLVHVTWLVTSVLSVSHSFASSRTNKLQYQCCCCCVLRDAPICVPQGAKHMVHPGQLCSLLAQSFTSYDIFKIDYTWVSLTRMKLRSWEKLDLQNLRKKKRKSAPKDDVVDLLQSYHRPAKAVRLRRGEGEAGARRARRPRSHDGMDLVDAAAHADPADAASVSASDDLDADEAPIPGVVVDYHEDREP